MHVPGLTTARLQLLLAAVVVCTGTRSGLWTAVIILLVAAARRAAVHHQAAAGPGEVHPPRAKQVARVGPRLPPV